MLKLPSRSPVQSLSARCHGEVGWDWKLCPSVCQHFWACQLPPAGRWRGHRTPLRALILSLKRLELPLESLWDRSFIYPCIDSAALYGVSLWTSRGAVLCKCKGDCGWGHTPSGRSLPPCSVTASLYCAVPQPHSHVRVRFSSNLYNCSFRISLGCLLVSVLLDLISSLCLQHPVQDLGQRRGSPRKGLSNGIPPQTSQDVCLSCFSLLLSLEAACVRA